MPTPLPPDLFALLVARAGITLTAEEAARIHAVSGHVAGYMAAVRGERPIDAEPATTFRLVEPGR
jgi:hypothetical protein